MDRRRMLAAGAATMLAGTARAEPERDVTARQDFDEFWETLAARYCFFPEKATDWRRVKALYGPKAYAAEDEAGFQTVLQAAMSELYDAHTHLADPPDGTPRFPPYDLWVLRQGDEARVLDVQPGSGAALAGVRHGDAIIAIERVPIFEAAARLAPKCLRRSDPAADRYALQSAAAGRRGKDRLLTVEGPSGRRELLLTRPPAADQAVSHRALAHDLGYIRIPTFADSAAVPQFDVALADLRETKGLIIDVRSNGGGDTAVAKPIMGRFIEARKPYATMRRRQGAGLSAPWTEWVEPRGPFRYAKPVTVLADRWSGSMGEGFPMGMRAVAGARIVGTPMMGLGAAVYQIHLDRTGIAGQYSGEPVYTPDGKPRWLLKPDLLVQPTTLDRDEILEAAIADLTPRV